MLLRNCRPPKWRVSRKIPEKSPKSSAEQYLGAKQHIKKKHKKQKIHGIVPGFWGGILFRPPPIALQGIAIPIAPMFFRYCRVSRYTPPNWPLLQLRGEGGRGYRSSSCPLEGIALSGGIAEIASPIAV